MIKPPYTVLNGDYPTIKFGEGLIQISLGLDTNDNPCVILETGGQGEIGSVVPLECETNAKTEVVLSFSRAESAQVLIDQLREVIYTLVSRNTGE